MRVPGIHVLLTAGVVAVTSIGTVAAFSLTGSSEAEQRLPAVAPPPAVAAPLEPAPLPPAPPAPASPAPVVEQETSAPEPTRDATPERDRSDDGDRPTRERRPDPPKDKGDDKPGKSTVKPDRNGTDEQKLAYACQAGFLHGDICKRYT
ncbi:hypothetical protein [Pseudonocardia endophytica]|uniref:Uncharacterized protein n=1 Tax=Pseudonocardia endophytica TaxID=401976 RepID=A0A4R1I040_PSEEN|nr:hypothetical protein [Pseudonocardia endophytica]TCK26560.1 hypothetical protein EV378_2398 [Pseudonocardia endophytica]